MLTYDDASLLARAAGRLVAMLQEMEVRCTCWQGGCCGKGCRCGCAVWENGGLLSLPGRIRMVCSVLENANALQWQAGGLEYPKPSWGEEMLLYSALRISCCTQRVVLMP